MKAYRFILTWPALALLLALLAVVSCSSGGSDDDDSGGDVDDDTGDDDDTVDDDDDDDDTGDDDDDDAGPAGLAVLTINLQHPLLTGLDVEGRTQIVADLINAELPDLVALQEVTQNLTFANRAEVLAELTGYEWIWIRAYNAVLFEEGIAVLARGTIGWSDDTDLPHPDLSLFERRVLGVSAETEEGTATVYVTHMTTADNQTEKADQALTIWDFIAETLPGGPVFFAGDLNADPDTLAMRFLRGEAEYEGVSGDFIDAWIAANGNDLGYTHPAKNPKKRIDYIYQVPGEAGEPLVVASCERVLTEAVDGLWASDHLGVLCRFEPTAAR